MPGSIRSPQTESFAYLAPEMSFGLRAALANLWLTRPLITRMLGRGKLTNATIRTTIAPTVLEGSPKVNVLASRARAVLNVRLLPGDRVADATAHIERAVNDPAVRVRVLQGSEATPVSDFNAPGGMAIQRAARSVFPDAVTAPSLMIGASDARYYVALGRGTYRFIPFPAGPEIGQLLHGIDERVAVGALVPAARFYAVLIGTN
jgi:carboxypeptidase PM20D1